MQRITPPASLVFARTAGSLQRRSSSHRPARSVVTGLLYKYYHAAANPRQTIRSDGPDSLLRRNLKHRHQHQRRMLPSSKAVESTSASGGATPVEKEESAPAPVVYESPLGGTVSRLRALSLVTMLSGVIGVPCVLAVKGVVPEWGMLATAMTFVSATSASTAAVNFVFRPYIYTITAIPVRQCSYKKKQTAAPTNGNGKQEDSADQSSDSTVAPTAQLKDDNDMPKAKKETLLKAVTRNLFLRQMDVVFNPDTDVKLYKGLRPLCNFEAKGVPLYVHSGT